MGRHILIVDDEPRIREVVQYALEQAGFRVSVAPDATSGLHRAKRGGLDLIVLDVMLPDGDGIDLCRQIRASVNTPILFLSARGEEIDRVVGLEVGGDDYLAKPFSPRELLARVRAILRRTEAAVREPRSSVLCHGGVSVDVERREVHCQGHLVHLTPTEFAMLVALLGRPGIVLSREQLVRQAYSYDTHVTERSVDTHIRRMRAKFRARGASPIATVHGVGYKADGG